MPTLLGGAISYCPTEGIRIRDFILSEQADDIYNAIETLVQFQKDIWECEECTAGGRGPFSHRCSCDMPLDVFLILRDEFRKSNPTMKERRRQIAKTEKERRILTDNWVKEHMKHKIAIFKGEKE